MARPKKSDADAAHKAEMAEAARKALDAQREVLMADAQSMAIKTLTGDLRDMVLNKLKFEQAKRPWNERSESDQKETIHDVTSGIQEHVRRAVELIAAGGLPTIKATLDQVVVKEGLKLVLVMGKEDEQRHQIMDAVGGTVLLVVADASAFIGERAPVPVIPDQKDLEHVLAEYSGDEADHAAEHSDAVSNGKDKPGWRPDRDAIPTSSPLN